MIVKFFKKRFFKKFFKILLKKNLPNRVPKKKLLRIELCYQKKIPKNIPNIIQFKKNPKEKNLFKNNASILPNKIKNK